MRSHEPSCEWVREHLDALIDDEFESTPQREAFAHHVASCDACARELAWARRVRAELRALQFGSAPAAAVARAQTEIDARPAAVVPLRPKARLLRGLSAVAAAVVIIAALTIAEQRRRAAQEVAVEQAARDAAIAFAYVGKYTRRAGEIVESEVIEQRLLVPVGKAMEKSGVTETKSAAGRS